MIPYIDVTRPLGTATPVWPGRPRPSRRWDLRISRGDHCNASSWRIGAHAGTHMDAPLHFLEGGTSIDRIPPDAFIGPCLLVDLSARRDKGWARRLRGVRRLLVRTRHSRTMASGRYPTHGPLLQAEAAAWLLDQGLVLLGTDRLSVDASRTRTYALHRRLLEAGCVIVEGMDLAQVAAGEYRLFCAPLRLAGGDASPVRALLGKDAIET